MDKTLLRPLFQKRYMEMNKPQGFLFGGVAMQADQARQRQSGLMNLAQANIYTNPNTGIQQNIEIEEIPKQDVNITESIVSGRENQKALAEEQEDTGIMSIEPPQNKKDDTLSQEIEKYQAQSEVMKATQNVTKQPVDQPLFSDDEKKGIFAANLAIALAQQGDPISNLAMGLGRGAMSIGKLKAAEAEIKNKKSKFAATKKAIDTQTNSPVYVTEAQIQTVTNADGSPRYLPEGSKKSQDIGSYLVRQDDGTYAERIVPKYKVFEAVDSGDLTKYKPFDKKTGESFKTFRFARDAYGFKKGDPVTVTDSEIRADLAKPPNERLYMPTELTDDQAMRQLLLTEKAKEDMEIRKGLRKEMDKAEALVDLIGKVDKRLDVTKGGSLGSLTRFIGTSQAFGNFLAGKRQTDLYSAQGKDNERLIKQAILNPKEYAAQNIDNARKRAEFVKLADAFNKRVQAEAAGLETEVIELAYALAKAREEGGRFSVSDIELAMRSINAGVDSNQFRSSLYAIGSRVLRQPLKKFSRFYKDFDPKELEKEQFKYLEDRLRFYDDPFNYKPLKKEGDKGLKDFMS